MKYTLLVKGSHVEPYKVNIETSGNFSITCNCAAGHANQFCKHRKAILDGDYRDVQNQSSVDKAAIQKAFTTSTLASAMVDLANMEKQELELKDKIVAQKKKVARLCNG